MEKIARKLKLNKCQKSAGNSTSVKNAGNKNPTNFKKSAGNKTPTNVEKCGKVKNVKSAEIQKMLKNARNKNPSNVKKVREKFPQC